MGNTYTKLFESILDSTVWQEPLATKIVWITMLAMCDKEGRVWASVPGLAKRAGVKLEEGEAALKRFMAPDKYSRSQEAEGRRVREIDGGWELINHAKYRALMSKEERREYQRMKQAEYRAKNSGRKSATQVRAEYDNREKRYVEAVKNGDEVKANEIAAEGIPEIRVDEGPELEEEQPPFEP